jgi:hypothetical protein
LLDKHWTIKLANWENHLLRQAGFSQDLPGEERIWLSPELLKAASDDPTKPCDVYSFGLILVSIFTREKPFGAMDTAAVIQQVTANNLRPDCKGRIPDRAFCIAKKCWHQAPELRPTASYVQSSVQKSRASKKTVLEHMLNTLSSYAEQLEERVAERSSELSAAKQSLEGLLHQMLPCAVADELQRGRRVEPASYDSVTICFIRLVDFSDACSSAEPKAVIAFLDEVYRALDQLVEDFGIQKVETIADSYMCLSGLGDAETRHASRMADFALRVFQTGVHMRFLNQTLKMQAGEKIDHKWG